MSYVPMQGHMFIMAFKPIESDHVDPFGVVTRTSFSDRSYNNEVFKCAASDDHIVVGERTQKSWSDAPVIFRRTQCVFSPVSPQVLAALGLLQQETP